MRVLLVATIAILLCISAHATIYRIGYPGTTLTNKDYAYTKIDSAMTAAQPGDTLQMYQQYWPGAPAIVNVTKPLVFIGFGYLLNKNIGLQVPVIADGNLFTMNFNSGSGGSTVMGIYFQPTINTSNITIRKCRLYNCMINNVILLNNIIIRQCIFLEYALNYCDNGYPYFGSCYYYANIRELGSQQVNNLHISNCYLNYGA